MSKSELERLQEREEQLRKDIANEEARQVATQKIVSMEKKHKGLLAETKKLDAAVKRLHIENETSASFQRVGDIGEYLRGMAKAFNPNEAIYKTTQEIAKSVDQGDAGLKVALKATKTLVTQYPKNVAVKSFKASLGVIDRFLVAGLGAADPSTAIYRAEAEAIRSLAQGDSKKTASRKKLLTLAKQYPKTIYENLGTAVTGRDFRTGGRKGFGDILRDIEGKPDNWKTSLAGFLADVITSPTTFIPGVGLGKQTVQTGGKAFTKQATISLNKRAKEQTEQLKNFKDTSLTDLWKQLQSVAPIEEKWASKDFLARFKDRPFEAYSKADKKAVTDKLEQWSKIIVRDPKQRASQYYQFSKQNLGKARTGELFASKRSPVLDELRSVMDELDKTPLVTKASAKISEVGATIRASMKDILTKVPGVKKGIDAVGKRFDIFWELRKTMPKEELTQLRQALTPAIETKDFSDLIDMGLNPTQFTKHATSGLGKRAKELAEQIKGLPKDINLQDLWRTFQSDLPEAQRFLPVEMMARYATRPLDNLNWAGQERVVNLLSNEAKPIIAGRPKAELLKRDISVFAKRFLDQAKSGELFQSARTAAVDALKVATDELDKIKNIPIQAKDLPTYDALKQIFGDLLPKVEATGAKKVAVGVSDFIIKYYKKFMSHSPRFQTRNFTGAAYQNISEGTGARNYLNAWRLLRSGGETNPEMFREGVRHGLVDQPGMYEQAGSTLTGKIARKGEALNRFAYVDAQVEKGIPIKQAMLQQQKLFYKYAPEWFTSFEKDIHHIFPFWAYMKGQATYQPGAVFRRAPFHHGMGLLSEDTKSKTERDYPDLVPGWLKNQMTLFNIGGLGTQTDDWLRLIGGDLGGIFSQTSPQFRGTVEGVTGWNFFKDKAIAEDPRAGQIANVPILREAVGFNKTTGTVDPIRKYLAELTLGPILGPIMNARDPKKPWYSSLTSIRDYDTSLPALHAQDMMNRREDAQRGDVGIITALLRRLMGKGAQSSIAATLPAAPAKPGQSVFGSDAAGQWARDYITGEYTKRGFDPESYGKRFIPGMNDGSMTYINTAKKIGEEIAKAMLNRSSDIGKNMADAYQQTIDTQREHFQAIYGPDYERRDDVQLWLKTQKEQYETMKPRTFDDATLFKPEDMIYRKGIQATPIQQAYNKAYDEMVQFASKTADIWRAASGSSFAGIERGRDADIKGVQMQVRGSLGGISPKMAEQRIAAIKAKAIKDMEELESRGYTASSNLLKAWADGEVDALHKIEYERMAAQEEFKASKDYSFYRDNHMYDLMNQHRESIDRKYATKRNEQLAKEAKEYMEIIELSAKGTADRVVQALDDVYKRGGMNIEEYYTTKLRALTKEQSTIAGGALQQTSILFQAGALSAPEGSTQRAALETAEANANRLYDTIRDMDDPAEALKLVEEALNLFSERLEGVDAKGMAQAMQHLQKVANMLKAEVEEAEIKIRDAKLRFDEAIRVLQQETQDLSLKNAMDMTQGGLINWAFTKPSEKFGADTTPKYQWGRDFTSEQQAQQLRSFDQGMVSDFTQLQQQIPGDTIFRDQAAGEGDRAYMEALSVQIEQIETIWATHEERIAVMGEEGAEKYNAIRDKMIEKEKERNVLLVSMERETLMNRMQMSQQIAQGIGNIAENLYEASGRQSKEAFYVMKAAKFAEAAIAGAAAVIKAYDAAAGNPYLGTAYAAIIAAQVGVQLGIIAAQTIQGKAAGGPITGGSGRKDDVPILAMGGEYVIRKSSVDKYGVNVMDAINNGLLPLASLNFSIPAAPVPDTNRRLFTDGGAVMAGNLGSETAEMASQELQIVNVIDPKLLDKYVAGADGQRTILNVLAANSYEVKRMLR